MAAPPRAVPVTRDLTLCRDYGHAWQPYSVDRVTKDRRRFFLRTLRCRVCQTLRSHVVDTQGYVISGSNHYSYPQGYLVKGGFGTDEKAAARLAHIESMLFDEIVSEEAGRD